MRDIVVTIGRGCRKPSCRWRKETWLGGFCQNGNCAARFGKRVEDHVCSQCAMFEPEKDGAPVPFL